MKSTVAMIFLAYFPIYGGHIMSDFSQTPRLQNNIFRYGEYCGPGPDDSQWGKLKPVDHLDQLCRQHDIAYSMCLFEFSREYGSRAPKHLNQLMPIRGLLPDFLRSLMYSQYRLSSTYVACMHQADAEFVSAFDQIQHDEMLPSWWSQPEIAPEGAEGVSGYSEACALGISSHGVCLVPLKTLFATLIEVFRLSILRDRIL